MNALTPEISRFLNINYTVLDLCCGHGVFARGMPFSKYVGVDIVQKYLDMSTMKDDPGVTLICEDVVEFCKNHNEKYDVVMAIDAIEHLTYEDGVFIVNWAEKHATKKVIIFTPENSIDCPTYNEANNVWGVPDGDKYQRHLSMFKHTFFTKRGYWSRRISETKNSYDGIPFYEMLYVLNK